MKSKYVLSVEQMEHLQELGLDTSDGSMCFEWNESDADNMVVTSPDADTNYDYYHETYTLQDILDKLPPVIKKYFCLSIRVSEYKKMWHVEYEGAGCLLSYFHLKNLIDAAYETLCWCVENGYIGKENNYE